MTGHDLVYEYLDTYNLSKIDDSSKLKKWLEDRLQKRMKRPLMTAKGSGGGQKYKLFWDTFDDEGNANKPCYYWTETKAAIPKLLKNKHLPLQNWVDDESDYLKY